MGLTSSGRQRASPSPWAWRVATVLGIPIRIHVTFVLLLFWFGTISAGQGEGFLSGVVFLLLLFGCVVLHELGHAAAARMYGVETHEIVLYPIGGVARLERIPSGKAELVIALAGPFVNLLLAGALFLLLIVTQSDLPQTPEELVARAPVLLQMLAANLALFLFNLIPAFPMDGGRVLRASLALAIGQDRATQIASRIGQLLAVVLAVFSLFPGPPRPLLLLIALFVFMGAGQESLYQRSEAAVRGLPARAAMVTRFETLAPQDSLERAAQLLLTTHQQDFPVVDAWGRVAGVLPRSLLLAGLAAGGRDRAVLELMEREPTVVNPETPLEQVLQLLAPRPGAPVLVVGNNGLEGMITLENLSELIEIRQIVQNAVERA